MFCCLLQLVLCLLLKHHQHQLFQCGWFSGLILQKDPSFLEAFACRSSVSTETTFTSSNMMNHAFQTKLGFHWIGSCAPRSLSSAWRGNALVPLLLCTYNRTHISLTHCLPCLISKPLGEYGWVMDPTECCVGVVWVCSSNSEPVIENLSDCPAALPVVSSCLLTKTVNHHRNTISVLVFLSSS